jgi:hypothetical protein
MRSGGLAKILRAFSGRKPGGGGPRSGGPRGRPG